MESVESTETIIEVSGNDAIHSENMEVFSICILFAIGVLCGLVVARILFNKVRY